MEFLISCLKVLAGAFLLFKIALRTLPHRTSRLIYWKAFMGLLAFATMLAYRLINHDVNVPAFTVMLFALVLYGLDGSDEEAPKVMSGALIPIAIGGLAGWLTFAELVVM